MLVDVFYVHAPMHTSMYNILYKPPPLIQAFLTHTIEIALYLGICVKYQKDIGSFGAGPQTCYMIEFFK